MNIGREKTSFRSRRNPVWWMIVVAIAIASLIVRETGRTSIRATPNLLVLKKDRHVSMNKVSATAEIPNRWDCDASPHLPSASDEADQLQSLHPADRIAFIVAALQQAARTSPAAAVSEAIRFCDLDPSYSLEYGQALISTLASSHDFSSALRFVLAEESEGELGENGNKWLNFLFSTWGKEEPRRAAQVVDTVVSPGLRGEALQALAAGWAKVDPSGLADYILQRPPTPEREDMLVVALRSWIEDDPEAAKAWMNRRDIFL